jgi:ketosteroid isomerase-like protein
MKSIRWIVPAIGIFVAACAAVPGGGNLSRGEKAREEVIATERAFAKTMADRDLKGFASFVTDEAVFFSGGHPLRGKKTVVEWWSRFYAKPAAPFAWEPAQVEVLDSGTLALSTGPVHDAQGTLIGCFISIWRQQAPGQWRIVFDRGSGPQECGKR